MPITVHSPHSGHPVKVRDQDLERAVRDEQGKIFYVVQRPDGEGYYASMTRKGSEKDIERYEHMVQQHAAGREAAARSQADRPPMHDATGRRRRGPQWAKLALILLLLAAVAAGIWWWLDGRHRGVVPVPEDAVPELPVDVPPVSVPEPQVFRDGRVIRVVPASFGAWRAAGGSATPWPQRRPDQQRVVGPTVDWIDPTGRSAGGGVRRRADRPAAATQPTAQPRQAVRDALIMHGGPVPFEHRPEEPGKPISLGSRWDTLDWSRFEHRPASEPSQKTPRVLTAQALVPAVDGVAGTDSAEVHAERDAAVEQPALPEPDRSWRVDVSGLRWQQVTPPMVDDAPAATAGRFAVIHFEATTLDARPIASTREGQPVGFVLWAGQTMQALDVGVVGMRIGERRRLVAPRGLLDAASPASTEPTEPAMLEDGAPLPADAVVLDVELVDVRPGIDVQVQRSAGGVPAFPGDRVQFHYAGRLAEDGRVFQDSREHGGPMTVHLGDGSLIAGLELGLIGAAEGEVRDVRIPPHLAYGRRGWGSIVPGGASVIYRVEVIRVEPALQMSGTP